MYWRKVLPVLWFMPSVISCRTCFALVIASSAAVKQMYWQVTDLASSSDTSMFAEVRMF